MRKAVFFDRDGIINEDFSYIYKPEDFRFMDGIFEFCHEAQKKGYLLIIVTNQSGIARGYYTEEDFGRLNDWMCHEFELRGICINAVYYCPYHPEKGIGRYKRESADRKPSPGMLLKAIEKFDIVPDDSIMLGDRDSDMEAGRRAGIGRLVLMPGKYEYTPSDDVRVVRTFSEAEDYLY